MGAAMNAVKHGCSVKRVAEEHGVPRTTLDDRVSGSVKHGIKSGPVPYLNHKEEMISGGSVKCRIWKDKETSKGTGGNNSLWERCFEDKQTNWWVVQTVLWTSAPAYFTQRWPNSICSDGCNEGQRRLRQLLYTFKEHSKFVTQTCTDLQCR